MTNDNKIRDKILQHDINKEGAKTTALSSGKTDRCEYVTIEGILHSGQNRTIEQAKVTYASLEKALEK